MKDNDDDFLMIWAFICMFISIMTIFIVVILSYNRCKNDLKYNIRNISIECPYCKQTNKLTHYANTGDLNLKCKYPSFYGPKNSKINCEECGKKIKVEINEYFNLIPRRINE